MIIRLRVMDCSLPQPVPVRALCSVCRPVRGFSFRMNSVLRIPDTFWQMLTEGASHYAVTILSIGVLVWTALRLRSLYREDSDPAGDRYTLLLEFKELRRQGNLTEDEYRSISRRLTGDCVDSLEPGVDSSAAIVEDEPAGPSQHET